MTGNCKNAAAFPQPSRSGNGPWGAHSRKGRAMALVHGLALDSPSRVVRCGCEARSQAASGPPFARREGPATNLAPSNPSGKKRDSPRRRVHGWMLSKLNEFPTRENLKRFVALLVHGNDCSLDRSQATVLQRPVRVSLISCRPGLLQQNRSEPWTAVGRVFRQGGSIEIDLRSLWVAGAS